MMKSAIELHDSKCLAIQAGDLGQGYVLLDAYVHRTDGDPAFSEGGVQRVRLTVGAMTVEGDAGELPAYVYEGSLTTETSTRDNVIPVPATYSEAFRLTMMLSEDARVVAISGNSLSIETEGEFRFVEATDFTVC